MENRPRKLICRRCGEHIDTRTKRADGSLQCPNCKVIYRPRSDQSQQRNHARKPQKRRKSMKLIAGIAFLLLLLIILVGSCGNNENDTITSPIQEQPINEIDSNTTAKVDDLITKAKADAESANAAALASNAWNWIVETFPEWYNSNEIMEQTIYNGALVEYYFTGKDDVRAEVGMDTVQAVKYVYRGVETVLDDATQENIRQIQENIETLSASTAQSTQKPTQPLTQIPTATPTPTETVTLGERNALSRAKSYLEYMPFSYIGLGKQLMYEGYTKAEAKYAVDNCGADWYEQAAKKAKSYLEYMSFSRDGLIEQLEYEDFTHDQAVYGVTQVGY